MHCLLRTLTVVLAGATLVAACSSDAADPDDIAFVRGMIPHHEQAVEMTDLVADAGASSEVVALAEQIAAAQGPEIERMNAWLDENTADDPHAGHGDHDDHASMTGMLSDTEMAALAEAQGSDFDLLFLKLMIVHHEGAVAMAEDVIEEGTDPEIRTLAEEIISAQQAEIDTMTTLIGAAG